MRPITRLLILLAFVFGLYHYLSLRQANLAVHRTAIVQAYHFAVQLARRNEERATLSLGDPFYVTPPSAEALRGTAIRSLSYEQGGAMRIELDARSGRDGGVIVYLPLIENGVIERWTCVTPDYPDIASYLPACRYMER